METIRYTKAYKEDLAIGSGSEEVTLSDGRVVSLTKIGLPLLVGTTDESVTQGASTHAVTFGDVGTSNYQVLAETSWWTYWRITSKTSTGFTFNFADEAPASATVRFSLL